MSTFSLKPFSAQCVVSSSLQHLFPLRIDPAVDGHNNTLYYKKSIPLPVDPEFNPFGMGYVSEQTVLRQAGHTDLSVQKNRVFKIQNDVSRKPVGYKLHVAPSQMPLMRHGSFARRCAAFAERAVWVTRYRDGELYAASEFTNQSRKDTGLSEWASRGDNAEDTDIVLWQYLG